MSFDEYNSHEDSFDSINTSMVETPVVSRNKKRHTTFGSLALELANALDDDSPESPSFPSPSVPPKYGAFSSQETMKPRPISVLSQISHVSTSDYSGEDYGDPADDSDPDGRFEGLNQQIANLVSIVENQECVIEDTSFIGEEPRSDEVGIRQELSSDQYYDNVDDQVIPRLVKGLQNLHAQSAVESAASKLISVHTALSTSLQNRMLLLRDLIPSSATGYIFDLEERDKTFGDLLSTLVAYLPHSSMDTLVSLRALHFDTEFLVHDLSCLSDALSMTRQSSAMATRKLREVKDAVNAWKCEGDQTERARMFLEKGNWNDRIRNREAGAECKKVIGGFNDVCDSIRMRIASNA